MHDGRAWLVFFLLASMLMATVPFAQVAFAQLPEGLPVPIPGQDDPPQDDPPQDDPPPDQEPDPGPVPAPPGGETPESPYPTAYYTSPTSDLTPGAATDPTVQCVVIPDSCAEGPSQITNPIRDNLTTASGELDSGSEGSPQPVPEDALPVGLLNGNQRYSSAVGLSPDPLPEGQTYGEYLVTFTFSSQSFSLESPAFRAAVTATVAQAGTGGPELYQAFLEETANNPDSLLSTEITGLEACVISEPFEPGPNQPVENEPEVDFLYCSPSAQPDANNQVTFDLSFPAADFAAGFIEWEGILIRPLAAQNLAYGDADYSTNYYAYIEPLSPEQPTFAQQTEDLPEPSSGSSGGSTGGAVGGTTGGSSSGGSSGGSSSGGSSGGGRGSGGSGSSGGSSSGGSSPSASQATGGASTTAAASPSTGADAAAGSNAVDDLPAPEQLFTGPFGDEVADMVSNSFLPYLLLPMLLGGSLWYGRVLNAVPQAAVSRAGAMTRLLRERGFTL